MKRNLFTAVCVTIIVWSLNACSIFRTSDNGEYHVGVHQQNALHRPETRVNSVNEYNLDVSDESITYTIDVSTPEGRTKLNGLTLREAEDLALTEAIIKHGCAALVNPQFTNLMKGKKILRITVYGFPAKYKNLEK